MARICPVPSTSDAQAVTATAAKHATAMVDDGFYLFLCSSAAWIKQGDLVETYAELSGGGAFNTVIRAATRGTGGNSITVRLVGDSAAAAGVTIGVVGNAVTIHFEDGVSTVANVETAIAGASLIAVKTAGTGATVLAAATDEITPAVSLTGGGAVASPVAAAADASVYVPAATATLLDGTAGDSLSVIRATADGTASLTRAKVT